MYRSYVYHVYISLTALGWFFFGVYFPVRSGCWRVQVRFTPRLSARLVQPALAESSLWEVVWLGCRPEPISKGILETNGDVIVMFLFSDCYRQQDGPK